MHTKSPGGRTQVTTNMINAGCRMGMYVYGRVDN